MFMCPCEIALRRENKSVICIKPLSSWLPTHVVANVHKWEKAKGVNTPRTVSNGGNTIGLWKREKALDNNLPRLCCVLPSAQQINLSASALCLSNLRRIYKHKNENKLKPHTADPIHWFSHYIDIHFFNINIVWRSTYLIYYKRYTPERGKARLCVIPFDDMSTSCLRIIRASHDQSAPPASNLDHEAPTPLPSWLLLGLCVRPTKGVRSPKCVWVQSQIIFLGLARFRQP